MQCVPVVKPRAVRRYRFGSARSVPSVRVRDGMVICIPKFFAIAQQKWRSASCATVTSIPVRASHRYSVTR
ncbi:hypothetical protein DF147_00210 [Burkholderia cenocepacia]|nr:hypothetical protein DF147_00210 [Burkholderia cenocepacia]RQV91492.1 hypothetical protein DF019_00210 [Burkholderia cenocepacia]